MASVTLESGQLIGDRFRVSEQLTAGALGEAYRVVDKETQQYGIVRILPEVFAKRKAISKAFLDAVESCRSIENNTIASIIGVGDEPAPYVVEAFVEGIPLSQLLQMKQGQGQGFSYEEISSVVEQLVQACNYLHKRGQVVGGIFPDNLFMAGEALHLTQSYLYAALPPEALVRIYLRDEERARYLPPEFVATPAGLTPAADVYSMAVLIWEMLAGRSFENEFEELDASENYPEEINKVLARALSEKADKRFPSVTAFALELARAAGDEEKARTLEQVVLAEAQEAAEKAVKTEPRPTIGEETIVESLAAIPPKPPREDTALFDDDDLHEETGESPAPELTSAQTPMPPEPVESVSASSGSEVSSSKIPMLIAAVVLVAALAGAAVYFAGGSSGTQTAPVQAKPATVAPDPMLELAKEARSLAEKSRQAGKKKGADALGGWALGKKAFAGAEAAQESGQFDNALKLYQTAQRTFEDVLHQAEEEKKREVEAERAAKAEKKKQAQAAAAKPAGPSCPSGMTAIAAGDFTFGSPSSDGDRDSWEQTSKKVSTAGFCIDRYEYPNKKGATPKSEVSYSEARAMCAKAGKRLCMEQEWERACKGKAGTRYPYGKSFKQSVCNVESKSGTPSTVAASGKYGACKSSYGVYDMSGNLAEWTDSTMPGTSDRILKGGSSNRPGYSARCAARLPRPAGAKLQEFGFRCCSDL